jgi:oligosaccharide repeat unit polymerase
VCHKGGYNKLIFVFIVVLWGVYAFLLKTDVNMLMAFHILISFLALKIVKFDSANPITLYTYIFIFYTIGYPIVVSLGLLPDRGVTDTVIVLHTVGYIGFCLPVILSRPQIFKGFSSKFSLDAVKATKVTVFILVCLGFLDMLITYKLGAIKGVDDQEFSIVNLGVAFHFSIVCAAIFFIDKIIHKKNFILILFLFSMYFVMPLFISGERSFVVKFVISAIIIYQFYFNKISGKKLFLMIVFGFLIFGVSKQASNLFSIERGETSKLLDDGLSIGYLFYKEFKTSGRLTAAAIEKYKDSPSYGVDFLKQISNSFLPKPLRIKYDELAPVELEKVIKNNGSSVGLGYSIIASGYVNGGIIGVFLFMYLTGLLLLFLYRKSFSSPVYLVIYSIMVATLCINIRHGIEGTLASGIKSIVFPILLIMVFKIFLQNKSSAKMRLEMQKC